MLDILTNDVRAFDEANSIFIDVKGRGITLEHSLVSISKWESKWHKPFLAKTEKTPAELTDYFRCMTIEKNVDPYLYSFLTNDQIKEIMDYIDNPMTATSFRDEKKSRSNSEIITSELIYYWMVAYNIPFQCEKWHLNRLLTLIRICNIKNEDPKKMSKSEVMRNNHALNQMRRAQHRSKG